MMEPGMSGVCLLGAICSPFLPLTVVALVPGLGRGQSLSPFRSRCLRSEFGVQSWGADGMPKPPIPA